ncbi:MAG: M15 family metallopeptidase [Clostridiales bacterium]|nr:M15 family metallopeptidase [Candidatus Apopatocola equi]
MRKRRRKFRLKLRRLSRKTVLYLIMVPLMLVVLVKVSTGTEGELVFGAEVTAAPMQALDNEPQPTAEVVWVYPEGYVDLSDLPNVDISTWEFTLVNSLDRENYVRDSFYPQTESVEGFLVRVGVGEPLQAMLTACREAGNTVAISRAYMSYYEISYKFNGVASGLASGQNMSYEDAVKKAMDIAHYPGTDEHQLGVAVNFVDGQGETSATSPTIEWLQEHCSEYGFILRYPPNKSAQTGWSYTPNQFRYVGKDAAAYITDKGITLEEFLTAVKDYAASQERYGE